MAEQASLRLQGNPGEITNSQAAHGITGSPVDQSQNVQGWYIVYGKLQRHYETPMSLENHPEQRQRVEVLPASRGIPSLALASGLGEESPAVSRAMGTQQPDVVARKLLGKPVPAMSLELGPTWAPTVSLAQPPGVPGILGTRSPALVRGLGMRSTRRGVPMPAGGRRFGAQSPDALNAILGQRLTARRNNRQSQPSAKRRWDLAAAELKLEQSMKAMLQHPSVIGQDMKPNFYSSLNPQPKQKEDEDVQSMSKELEEFQM